MCGKCLKFSIYVFHTRSSSQSQSSLDGGKVAPSRASYRASEFLDICYAEWTNFSTYVILDLHFFSSKAHKHLRHLHLQQLGQLDMLRWSKQSQCQPVSLYLSVTGSLNEITWDLSIQIEMLGPWTSSFNLLFLFNKGTIIVLSI